MRLTQTAHRPYPARRPALRTRLACLLARTRSLALRRRNA
jgi:hypothetical protein